MNMTSHGGGDSGDLTKWLIYGGIGLVGVVILMKVLKKKKGDHESGHHEEN